jgi:AcrR family transcriptional regulator
MMKPDRRVQRTRELLQTAMMDLIHERGYEAITIQDILERANVGRTTFYVHFGSKNGLFMSCHEAIITEFQFGPVYLLSRDEWLSAEAPPRMVAAFHHLEEARMLLNPILQGKDGVLILRQFRDSSAQDIETSLRAAFAEADRSIPFDLLATYLAGARVALMQWWLEKRRPYTPEEFAQTFHSLQRAAIRDAFGL